VTRRILVAYTGGTIGMDRTATGYAPQPGHLRDQLAELPELRRPGMPEIELDAFDPLLDSSNMRPADWVRIAERLAARYDEFDGFVVLHGTDTMAYTSSALAFLLHPLGKPVVVTGSQLPLGEARTDARGNLLTALLVAAEPAIPEVTLLFGSKLLRGCRAVKVSADGFDAFDSPNLEPLGTAGVEIQVRTDLARPADLGRPEVPSGLEAAVGALRLFPGISADAVGRVLAAPLQGLVLEAYGAGNGPDRDERLLAEVREATSRGVVVVVVTQCLSGRVDLEAYATGSALARAGAVGGGDMTVEAALTKLFYLLGAGREPDEVRELAGRDLRGELTPA
jgi:L-asparaginase